MEPPAFAPSAEPEPGPGGPSHGTSGVRSVGRARARTRRAVRWNLRVRSVGRAEPGPGRPSHGTSRRSLRRQSPSPDPAGRRMEPPAFAPSAEPARTRRAVARNLRRSLRRRTRRGGRDRARQAKGNGTRRAQRPTERGRASGDISTSVAIEPSPAGSVAPRTSTRGRRLVFPDASSAADAISSATATIVARITRPAVSGRPRWSSSGRKPATPSATSTIPSATASRTSR